MQSMPGMQMPGSDKTPSQGAQQPMQGMDHSTMPGMTMPADQGSGQMQGMPGMPGMAMEVCSRQAPRSPRKCTASPLPTDHAADNAACDAMAMGRHHLQQHHGGQNFNQVLLNLAEYQFRNGRDGYRWMARRGSVGHQPPVRSSPRASLSRGHRKRRGAGAQPAIRPYFTYRRVSGRIETIAEAHLCDRRVEGLAPGLLNEGALFLSNKGDVLGRLEDITINALPSDWSCNRVPS
jgi:copper resistance protein B